MPQEQSNIKERQNDKVRIPQKYSVTIHNDDFTPMDFVVYVLTDIFFLSETRANELMLQVHNSDKAVVGVYSYDVAMSKAQKATDIAREEGYPLRLTVEPVEM